MKTVLRYFIALCFVIYSLLVFKAKINIIKGNEFLHPCCEEEISSKLEMQKSTQQTHDAQFRKYSENIASNLQMLHAVNGTPKTNCERKQSNLPKPKWQIDSQRTKVAESHYYLIEVLKVRIYDEDKAKWTIKELKQWIHYMLWAGVQHIFLCDHYSQKSEVLREKLKRYIDLSLLTYIAHPLPKIPRQAQVKCYNRIIRQFRDQVEWQMTVDMDEYPFVHTDTKEGFLIRYLKKQKPNVVEVVMPNYLMTGQGDRKKDLVIERINRINSLSKPHSRLGKPIYKPSKASADIHRAITYSGETHHEFGAQLKLLHYWGARTQKWHPDTPATLNGTFEFNNAKKQMGPIVRNSLLKFGEIDAFSCETGP